MQRRATIWILGAFHTSPSFGIEAIAGLIPIKLHLQKLSGRLQLRAHSLLHNHILRSLLETNQSFNIITYWLLLNNLTSKQQLKIKGPVVDMDNRFNKVFPSFDLFNKEFTLGHHLIDVFSNCFSFHTPNKQSDTNLKVHIQFLNNIALNSSLEPSVALVVSDASIKNHIATSIAHIHVHNKQVIKIIHQVVNITSTEAELFAIRCGINQATNLQDIRKIVIITDSIHSAKKIFDYLSHPFQVHTASISNELRKFFSININNTVKFWECTSRCNWSLYKAVDRETKKFCPIPSLPWKLSWDFSKKRGCNDLVNRWKMTFQASEDKGHNFLDLLDDNNNSLEPTYSKDRTWLKYFGHSNLLCVRALRAIVNHAPIGEYCLRFFPQEEFKCPCGTYPIETRQHILHECKRYNKYWNLRRDMIGHFTLFLVYNSNAFLFSESITWSS